MHKVLLILGTARKNNYSQYVATFVKSHLEVNPDVSVEMVDPLLVGFSVADEGQKEKFLDWKRTVATADCFVIVTPEYNHGYPGSLKMLLDLNFAEYKHKPVAIIGVSNGKWGGIRVIEALLPVLRTLGLVATSVDVQFTNIDTELENGKLKDPEKWGKRVDRLISELLWMSKTLSTGRNA